MAMKRQAGAMIGVQCLYVGYLIKQASTICSHHILQAVAIWLRDSKTMVS